jgi:8-oxo-dGTP diphosphatase
MPRRIAVAVVEHAGRYLIGRRPAGVPLAGFWEFPGGKVQPGETPQQAAQRECREETGLAVQVLLPCEQVVYEYDHGRLLIDFFACTLEAGDLTPRPPFCWVPAAELAQYPFPPANAGLVERLIRAAMPDTATRRQGDKANEDSTGNPYPTP